MRGQTSSKSVQISPEGSLGDPLMIVEPSLDRWYSVPVSIQNFEPILKSQFGWNSPMSKTTFCGSENWYFHSYLLFECILDTAKASQPPLMDLRSTSSAYWCLTKQFSTCTYVIRRVFERQNQPNREFWFIETTWLGTYPSPLAADLPGNISSLIFSSCK